MKKIILLSTLLLLCLFGAKAQQDSIAKPQKHAPGSVERGVPAQRVIPSYYDPYYNDPYYIEDPLFPTPHRAFYADRWDLHEGVNVRVTASATVGLGSGSPGGVGFGRSIDFLYVSPIKNKWSYAIGATTRGFNWGGYRTNDVALYGSATYYPSDKVTLSISGYKSLLNSGNNTMYNPYGLGYYGLGYSPFAFDYDGFGYYPYRPYGYYNRGHLDSYIGGDINIKLKRNSWLEIHVGASNWKQ